MTKQILKMFLIKITNNICIQKKQLYSINCNLLSYSNSPYLQYICFFTPCVSQPPIVLVDKSPNCWLLHSHFASLRLVAYAVFQKQIYCIYGSNKCKFKMALNLIQSNTVAQRRGFIYFIFERLRGDRRRNCMSFANNSF